MGNTVPVTSNALEWLLCAARTAVCFVGFPGTLVGQRLTWTREATVGIPSRKTLTESIGDFQTHQEG